MKLFKAVLIGPIIVILMLTGVAGAQSSYEGADLEDGIFFVPDTPTGGEDVNIAIADLAPGAEVTVALLDSNNQDVDGLEVAGIIAFRADANGSLNADFTLPPNLPDGSYSVVVNSTRSDGRPFEALWSFVVDSSAAPAAGADGATNGSATASAQDGDLAFTGANSRVTAVGGGVLVLLGLGLVVVAATASSRRRDGVVA